MLLLLRRRGSVSHFPGERYLDERPSDLRKGCLEGTLGWVWVVSAVTMLPTFWRGSSGSLFTLTAWVIKELAFLERGQWE